jgi:hypothetical protein
MISRRNFTAMLAAMTLPGCTTRHNIIRRQPVAATTTQVVPVAVVPRCDGRNCRRDHKYGLADVPDSQRHRNNNRGGGSCVFASIANNLELCGLGEEADWLMRNYWGGENANGLHAMFDAEGWDYSATTIGDVRLLDWCDRTSRGAMVTFKKYHVCGFLGYEHTVNGLYAVILDPNKVNRYEYYPKEEFLSWWRYYGGWATALLANPVP